MEPAIIIVFAVVLVVGGAILGFMTLRGGRTYLDTEKYRSRWLAIEQQIAQGDDNSYQIAILQADKLLDHALKERGFSGNTMGERMKSAGSVWTRANSVWTAHKIRNQIAHEADVKLSYDSTKRALAAFKQALKDVGAI